MNDTIATIAPTTQSAPAARYVLHERIGMGGQAEVWRAHDPERGAELALKILRPGAGRSTAAWQALQHEYDSASRLDHPYILKVYAPERDGDTFLLPMELATGGDLGRLRGASYLAVVPVLIEVAGALAHAHERGVIHRDLKSSNVLFDARGRVQLADFGVSGRSVDAGTDAMIRGLSPFSASPEQLRGEVPGPADDIYGLGALAYELLTKHPPYYPHFDARRVQEEPVPPLVPTLQIPAKLEALIMRMLAKRAADRPASMREVIEGLESTLNDTLTFDAVPAGAGREELPANATVQLPPEINRSRLAANTTIDLGDLPPPSEVSAPQRAARRTEPPVPAAMPPVPAAEPPVKRPSYAAADITRASPAAADAAPRPYVPPMRPVWQRAAMTAEPLRPHRRKRGYAEGQVPSSGDGALDGTALAELRGHPLRRPPLEPMRSGAPRVLLLLLLLASAAAAVAALLPKHFDAAAFASALAGAEAMVGAAVNPKPASPPAASAVTSTPSPAAAVPPAAAAPADGAAVKTSFTDDGYARAAGEGFAALGAGRLAEARAAFEHAHSLRPDGSEAQDGLRRVAAANQTHSFAAQRVHAEDLEAQERWQDAAEAYRSILRQDRTAAFAQSGSARVEQRLKLDASLQELLDHPQQLSSPAARDEAMQLLQAAAAEPSPGPVLTSQMTRLTLLLPGADRVVHVSLVSDSQTQVSISGVGTLGSFSQLEIQLKPGHYTVIGTRDGYREVRRDVTIAPGEENQTVNVSCDEPV